MTDGVNLQKHQTNVLEVKNLKKIYGPRTVVKTCPCPSKAVRSSVF